jgi:hypothetical protein
MRHPDARRAAVTTDVLPELARGGAELVRRALERPSLQGLTAAAIDGVLRQTLLTLDFLRDYRDRLSAELHGGGLEPAALRGACALSLGALDALADANRRLLSLPLAAAQRDEIKRQEAMALELRRVFDQWSEALGRPFPPIDWEKLAADAHADTEAGRMIRLEQFGDLFPSHPDEA